MLPASGKTALVPCLLQQARNFLRAMRLDEEAFFYHSNCREPGIAGLMKVGQGLRAELAPFMWVWGHSLGGSSAPPCPRQE